MRDYAELKRRIEELAALDTRHAARSRRPFVPPLTESQVAAFEKRNGITLPEEYRGYITHVANGGPGPGVEPLLPLDLEKDHHGALQRPFPFTTSWCPHCSTDCDDIKELQRRLGTTDLTRGALYIGGHGCTLGIHLVITGPMRGQIWVEDFNSDNGIWPEGDDCPCMRAFMAEENPNLPAPRRFTFYEWFDQWIKEEHLDLAAGD